MRIAGIALIAAALAAGSCNVRAAHSWEAVKTAEIDVECYGYWWAVHDRAPDGRKKAEAKRYLDQIVFHYTIPVFWKKAFDVPDIAESDYYAFQRSVADQFGREASGLYFAWIDDWNQGRAGDWKMERVRCMARDADLLRHKRTLADCMEDLHCTLPHDPIT